MGYPGLLNLEAQPHWTVFLTDFPLPPAAVRSVRRQLDEAATRLLSIRIDRGVEYAIQQIRAAGANLRNDYFSLHGIVAKDEHSVLLRELNDFLRRRDFARIDLPTRESGFRPSFATHLLGVVMRANYLEQDRISGLFFDLLALRSPYHVTIRTSRARLDVDDTRGWFSLAGRLRRNEIRSLPDGEVAYSSNRVDGQFVVDGAILPIPQRPRFADEARRLMPLSREVSRHPIRLEIRRGEVTGVTGRGTAPKILSKLFEKNERYRQVNEVGISFNRAVTRFIHSWPAASNEVRPGVHVGIGGAANPDDDDPKRSALVHIDCIAANCEVWVNGKPFLRASA